MTLFKSFSFRMASDLAVTAIAFANNVLVTRALGPEGRGMYALLMTAIALVTMLFGEGIRQANVYLVGKDRERAPELFFNTLAYGGVAGLFLSLLLWSVLRSPLLHDTGIDRSLFLPALCIAVMTLVLYGIYSIFLGLERLTEYNLLPILFILVYFCGNVFVLTIAHYGLSGVIWSWSVGILVSLIIASFLLWKRTGISRRLHQGLFRLSFRVGLKGMTSSLLLSLLFRVNIFLVGHFLGTRGAGIYSISLVFTEMFQRIPNAAGTILLPKVTSEVGEQKDALTASVSRNIMMLTLCIGAGVVLFGRWGIPWVFGKDFVGSYLPLVCMLPGVFVAASASIVHTNLWGQGYPPVAVIAPGVALLISIVLNLFLIPTLGLIGAGLATSVAYTLWGGLIFGYFVRHSSVSLRDLLVPRLPTRYTLNVTR